MAVVEASTSARTQTGRPEGLIARVSHGVDDVTIEWADGRHGPEGQRLFDVAELPEEPTIAAAALTGGDLRVEFAPGGPSAVYAAAWLRRHALDAASRAERQTRRRFWDKSLTASLPTGRYADVAQGGSALAAWLAHVRDFGFALLTGVPTEAGMVCGVI